MRKLALCQIPVFLLLSSTLTFAQPASLRNADITLSGIEFVQISGYYPGLPFHDDPANEGQDGCTWYKDGTAILTLWDHGGEANHYGHCLWVLYGTELTQGFWRLGLNAINWGAGIKDRQWYPYFEVLVELLGDSLVPPESAVVLVPASDKYIRSGFQWFYIPEDGFYGIKYTWLNDTSECADPPACTTGWDVNIVIDSVFFDKWSRGSGPIK